MAMTHIVAMIAFMAVIVKAAEADQRPATLSRIVHDHLC